MERKVDSDDVDYRAESNRMTNERRQETGSVKSIGKFEIREHLSQEENTQEEVRDTWTGKFDFFLSALSLSVGLGAVWRFPYLCYKNGGGAYVFAFLILLFMFGIPLAYLELAVGQFTSRGPIMSWVMMPLFKGVGVSMNLINNYVNIYYTMIVAYSLYYLVLSLGTVLPWHKCDPEWASVNCVDDFRPDVFKFVECDESFGYLKCNDGQCYLNSSIEDSCDGNRSRLDSIGYWDPIFPTEDFWNKVIIQKSSGIEHTGDLVWQLVLTLFISWLICYFCLFRGVKLSGKIGYFTGLFPYLMLFVLGIRGLLIDGAWLGIEYYMKPDLNKLLEIGVWKDAAVQVFFTLSLSYGGLIALSSYNKFHHNILRDAFLLSITNFLTCILAGFVVFVYIGALSKATNIDIEKVVQGGQGLVYIVYPYAATTIKGGPLWAVMFFVMMITLGVGSINGAVETLTTSLEDFFPYLKKTPLHKAVTLAVICFLYFLAGLILCSQAGTYWVEFFDTYSANYAILVVALMESVSVGWFYGTKQFQHDTSSMIPTKSKRLLKWHNRWFVWWDISWRFIIPLILAVLLVLSLIDIGPIVIQDYVYPKWSDILGNILSATVLFGVFGWMAYEIILVKFYTNKPLKSLIEKDPAWRPFHEVDYKKLLWVYQNVAFEEESNIVKF